MRIVLFANTDWYLYNFRRSLAFAIARDGHELQLWSPPGQYGEKLRELGFDWQPVTMKRQSLNPAREVMVLAGLVRRLRHYRPDLIHSFTIKPAVYGSLAAQIAGVPFRVNAVAGLGYVFIGSDVKARMLRPFVAGLMRLALAGDRARLVLQNPDDQALFLRAGLAREGTVRLIKGSGVDSQQYSPSLEEREPSVFRVLLPARLLWDKGVGELVQAAKMLRAEGRQIEFLLAGTPDAGNPASVPQNQLDQWQADGIVQCLGHVSEMATLYRQVDLVVLPSYREGLPKGLIEAAATGLPLIATDVPGCREVVRDNDNGFLVPVRDSVALAKSIAKLQDDPDLARRFGQRAREIAIAEFDEKIVIKHTLDVYLELECEPRSQQT